MVEEYESMTKKNVWEVVPRPINKLVVDLRWIFKVKYATNGSIDKYHGGLVAGVRDNCSNPEMISSSVGGISSSISLGVSFIRLQT